MKKLYNVDERYKGRAFISAPLYKNKHTSTLGLIFGRFVKRYFSLDLEKQIFSYYDNNKLQDGHHYPFSSITAVEESPKISEHPSESTIGFSVVIDVRPFHVFSDSMKEKVEFLYAFSAVKSIPQKPSFDYYDSQFFSIFYPHLAIGIDTAPKGSLPSQEIEKSLKQEEKATVTESKKIPIKTEDIYQNQMENRKKVVENQERKIESGKEQKLVLEKSVKPPRDIDIVNDFIPIKEEGTETEFKNKEVKEVSSNHKIPRMQQKKFQTISSSSSNLRPPVKIKEDIASQKPITTRVVRMGKLSNQTKHVGKALNPFSIEHVGPSSKDFDHYHTARTTHPDSDSAFENLLQTIAISHRGSSDVTSDKRLLKKVRIKKAEKKTEKKDDFEEVWDFNGKVENEKKEERNENPLRVTPSKKTFAQTQGLKGKLFFSN